MSLEAKGTIKYEEVGVDVSGCIFSKFSVKAPTLGIEQDLPKEVTSSDLAVQVFQRLIKEKVQQDFQRPIEITLVGMSISCSYYIDPINNRTLDEFSNKKVIDTVIDQVNDGALDLGGVTVTASRQQGESK